MLNSFVSAVAERLAMCVLATTEEFAAGRLGGPFHGIELATLVAAVAERLAL